MINIITNLKNLFQPKQFVLLFDSITAAQDIAFMLNGEWDGCNGVLMNKCDEVAVNTATSLIEATWCYPGADEAILERLTVCELLRRYAIGERNFINANLRCAEMRSLALSEVNLSWAKLDFADLSGSNLSKADLARADIQDANLSDTNLSQSRLFRANLTSSNLSRTDLKGANLSYACLYGVNLTEADLRGTNLEQADLRGANLNGALFDNCGTF
jgi:uncharacterized protein YjbI with pentapeptide repeats